MAKVRVEWVRLARAGFERGCGGVETLIAAQTITALSSAVETGAAPSFAADAEGQDGFARVSGLTGAVNIAWGAAPVASESNGLRLDAGSQVLIAISADQTLSIIEAADGPVAHVVKASPLQAEATAFSGAITAGGTAQDLMPANPARRGWRLQNQSTGDLYIASKGASGSALAALNQSSFRVSPGMIWTEDGQVSANALSVIGETAGQVFYAREW